MTTDPTHLGTRPPSVVLRRIHEIPTFEILESDVESLDQVVSAEATALGFFTGMGGTWAGAGLGWLSSAGLSLARQAIFGGVTLITAIFTVWFCVQWRRKHRERTTLLQRLRRGAAP